MKTVSKVEAEDNQNGWSLYENEVVGFSLMVPKAVSILNNQEEKSVRIVKFGPSQESESDFYDGIHLTLSRKKSQGVSLKDFAMLQHQNIRNQGAIEAVGPLMETKINGRTGYGFSVRGMGMFEYLYLEAGNDVLEIIDGSRDPTGVGLEEETRRMLDSINTW